MGRATVSTRAAAVLMAAGCSTMPAAPEHGGGDSSTDAMLAPDLVVDLGTDAGPCKSAADCMTGQVCCVTNADIWTTHCLSGPCPDLPASSLWPGGPFQLCRTAAECLTAGDVCPWLPNPGNLVLFCQPPIDADITSEPDAAPPTDQGTDAAADVGPGDTGAE
jgi:hypothetical protein